MMKAKLLLALALVVAVGVAGTDATQNIKSVVTEFRNLFCNLVPVAIMLAVAAAAVIYAGGQMLGAEQRAKTASWAAGLMTFAIVAGLVYVLVPWIIETIAAGTNLATAVNCNYNP